tara:strand:+ start:2371 stop:2580 length:210 start_codon:yes stop_codon:yes gene_type:complete
MKINELLTSFEIQRSNEEKSVLDKCSATPIPLRNFTERDRFILDGLIRKALVSKIIEDDGSVLVIVNEL